MGGRNSWTIQITSVIVLTFSLVLLGVIYSLIKSSRYAAVKSQQGVKLEVFFKENLKPETDFEWVDQIKAIPEVLNIAILTQEQAQAEFKKMMSSSFGSLAEEASMLSRLPSSISIQFQEGVSSETKKKKVNEIVNLAQQISTFDGHVYQQEWAEWLNAISQKAEQGIVLLGGFVFLIFFLIISNVIRSQVTHKQQEIEIHSFLGATAWQIEKPFIINSIILGFMSAALASLLTIALVQTLKSQLQDNSELISPELFLAPGIIELGLAAAVVVIISAWAARFCVRERLSL